MTQELVWDYLGREPKYYAFLVNAKIIEKQTHQAGKDKIKRITYIFRDNTYMISIKNVGGKNRTHIALFEDYCKVTAHILDREIFKFKVDVRTIGWYKRYESIIYMYKEMMNEGKIWNLYQ